MFFTTWHHLYSVSIYDKICPGCLSVYTEGKIQFNLSSGYIFALDDLCFAVGAILRMRRRKLHSLSGPPLAARCSESRLAGDAAAAAR